jgi:arylsulfatase A-like enzyme
MNCPPLSTRWLGASLGIVVVTCGSFADAAPPAAERRPNIVFILADDLGWGDLGCYGQKRIRTPRLDRLAREGMRFTDFYAGSTVCAPSRCALMTGRHMGHAHIRGNARHPLRPEDATVAELLKRAGYATGAIGKWGLGEAGSSGHPRRKGFDSWFGYLGQVHAHNYYPEFLWRDEDMVRIEGNVTDPKTRKSQDDGSGVAAERARYSHDLFIDAALEFIDAHQARPFFLYLALTIPHANNEAKERGMEVPDFGDYAGEDWPAPQKGHAAMISRMDAGVGRILDRLDERAIARDTVVFFSSDNGPHKEGGAEVEFFDSNGPLRGLKRDLYDGGIRVPMIVRWPGRVAAGSVSIHTGAFWDFLPTAAELAGVEDSGGHDGISFVPALLGKQQKAHEYLYWEFYEHGFSQAVRLGDFKAVRTRPSLPIEVYDLSRDLGESEDLSAKHPDVVERAAAIFKSAHEPSELWKVKEEAAKAGGGSG